MWERAGDRDCSCSDPVHTCKVLANIPFALCYAIHKMTLSSRWAPLGPEGLLYPERSRIQSPFLSSHMTQPFPSHAGDSHKHVRSSVGLFDVGHMVQHL